MIKLHKLEINDNSTAINLYAETNTRFDKLLLYLPGDCKKQNPIDLSYLLGGDTTFEEFEIRACEIAEVDHFSGLYFLEFTILGHDPDCGECVIDYPLTETYPVSNTTKYHLAILNALKLVTIDDDCNVDFHAKRDCSKCIDRLFLKNTLLEALYVAIKYGSHFEACKIAAQLDHLNEDCDCYNETAPYSNISGTRIELDENCVPFNKIIIY